MIKSVFEANEPMSATPLPICSCCVSFFFNVSFYFRYKGYMCKFVTWKYCLMLRFGLWMVLPPRQRAYYPAGRFSTTPYRLLSFRIIYCSRVYVHTCPMFRSHLPVRACVIWFSVLTLISLTLWPPVPSILLQRT